MSCSNKKQSDVCWNELTELQYLICAIDACKCPTVPPPPYCSIMLPPRIEEIPCVMPPRRPVCCPPPPCQPPLSCGPCCPTPLPPPSRRIFPPPPPPCKPCQPCTLLPACPMPISYCNNC